MDLTYSFMLPILEWLEKGTHSYGWSLVLLTLIVRVALAPLVAKQTIEMKKFAQVQPLMKELQDKYKDNPELFQKKMAEFVAKNKVNPMGGCLPLLLQIPIFFALFATFSGPPFADKPIQCFVKVSDSPEAVRVIKKETSSSSMSYVSRTEQLSKVAIYPGEAEIGKEDTIDFGVRAIHGAKLPPEFQPRWKITQKDGKPVKEGAATISKDGHAAFHQSGEYKIIAVIPGIAKNEQFGFVNGLGKVATGAKLLKPENFDALFLIVAFGASMFFSQKYMSTANTPKPGEELDDQQRVQQDVAKIMPVMMTGMFVVIPLPVGVLIYIVISNLVQSAQSWYLSKKAIPPLVAEGPDGEIKAEFEDVTESKNGDSAAKKSKKKTPKRIAQTEDQKPRADTTNAAGVSSFKRKTKKKKKK